MIDCTKIENYFAEKRMTKRRLQLRLRKMLESAD